MLPVTNSSDTFFMFKKYNSDKFQVFVFGIYIIISTFSEKNKMLGKFYLVFNY